MPVTEPERPVFAADEWGVLRRATRAMADGDTASFTEEFRTFSERGGYPDRCIIYVHYAVRYRSAMLAQADPPTREALRQIAAEAAPRYDPYVQPHVASLIEVLETVWQYRAPAPGVKGNSLVIRGCIALAAMLKHPDADLDQVEASLQRYIENNHEGLSAWLRDMHTNRMQSAT